MQDAYICNFTDDNSLYSSENNFTEVTTMLMDNLELLQGLFYGNQVVLSPGKCHYLIINKYIANKPTELAKNTLHAEAEQKLLGIIIDKDLKPYKVDYVVPRRISWTM